MAHSQEPTQEACWCVCPIPDRAHSGGVINSQIEPTQWCPILAEPVGISILSLRGVADSTLGQGGGWVWQIEPTGRKSTLSPCSEGPGMINSPQINALREVCMVSTGQPHALREVHMVSTGQAHALREVHMVSTCQAHALREVCMVSTGQPHPLREVHMVSTGQPHALREVRMVSTGQPHALREVCMVSGVNAYDAKFWIKNGESTWRETMQPHPKKKTGKALPSPPCPPLCAPLSQREPTRNQPHPAGTSHSQESATPTMNQPHPAGTSHTQKEPATPTMNQPHPAGTSHTQKEPAIPSRNQPHPPGTSHTQQEPATPRRSQPHPP